jgi:hypothetical protein
MLIYCFKFTVFDGQDGTTVKQSSVRFVTAWQSVKIIMLICCLKKNNCNKFFFLENKNAL